MTQADQDKAQELFARAIFSSGLPYSLFENSYWMDAFTFIRPAFKPPSKYLVGGRLLDSEFTKVNNAAQEKINNADCVSVQCDGWKNVRGEYLINFIVNTPQPVFYKIVEPNGERENSEYIGQQIIESIIDIGSQKVKIVITDNAAVMRAAWVIVAERFPHIVCIGCAAHTLDLLIEDFHPRVSFSKIVKMTKVLVITIKNTAINLSHFKRNQLAQKERSGKSVKALKLPPKTRFAYIVYTLESVLYNKGPIQQTVLLTELNIDRKVKNVALSEDYWEKMEAWLHVLKPIEKAITLIEADSAMLSDVVEAFHCIELDSLKAAQDSHLKKYKQTISRMIKYRKSFVMHDIHFATNLIDPRYRGLNLKPDEKVLATKYIVSMCDELSLNNDEVLADFADFKLVSGHYAREAVIKAGKHMQPIMWWKAFCDDQPLFPIAVRLLVLTPTTGACERTWSGFSRTHTKRRNRLKNVKVAKEVSIQMNLQYTSYSSAKKRKKSFYTFRSQNPNQVELTESNSDTESDKGENNLDYSSEESDHIEDGDWDWDLDSDPEDSDDEINFPTRTRTGTRRSAENQIQEDKSESETENATANRSKRPRQEPISQNNHASTSRNEQGNSSSQVPARRSFRSRRN